MPTPRGPFVPIPDTCKVEVLWLQSGSPIQFANVLHAKCSAAPSVGELTNVATAIGNWLTDQNGGIPSNANVNEIVVTDLNSATGPQVTAPPLPAGTDGVGNPSECAVVELFTALRGRSYRGRYFWPVAEDQVVLGSNTISTSFQSNLAEGLDDLQAALAALSPASTLVVASRKLHTSQAVTSYAVRAKVGRVRRRLFG